MDSNSDLSSIEESDEPLENDVTQPGNDSDSESSTSSTTSTTVSEPPELNEEDAYDNLDGLERLTDFVQKQATTD